MAQAPSFKIEISNLDSIKDLLSKYPTRSREEFNKAIRKAVLAVERESKKNSPVDTGRLRASHQVRISELEGEVTPTVNYAIYVHENPRAGRTGGFSPQGQKYKRFASSGGYKYLENAALSMTQNIQGFFAEAMVNIFK